MAERTWDDFLAFLYELPAQIRPGRQGIRVMRDNLEELVEEHVIPGFSESDRNALFPLGFSATESDLKLSAGVGLERKLITPQQYEVALRADKAAGPFGFMQTLSGKTLGETISPMIAQFWLCEEGDQFAKMPNTALYDFGWTPQETGITIRIEMKASSEKNARFQQIRHPRMTDRSAADLEYDILLCLGIANTGLEWWGFPAGRVAELIDQAVFTPQHSAHKAESGTFWVSMKPRERTRLQSHQADSASLRRFLMEMGK